MISFQQVPHPVQDSPGAYLQMQGVGLLWLADMYWRTPPIWDALTPQQVGGFPTYRDLLLELLGTGLGEQGTLTSLFREMCPEIPQGASL